MFSSWLATNVLSPSELAASNAPLLDVVEHSPFPTGHLYTHCPVRGAQYCVAEFCHGIATASVGLLPAWLGKLHPQRRTPYRTLLVILPIAIFLRVRDTAILSWNNLDSGNVLSCQSLTFSLTSRTPNQRV